MLQSWCNWTDCTSKYYKADYSTQIMQGRCLKTSFYLTEQNAEIMFLNVCFICQSCFGICCLPTHVSLMFFYMFNPIVRIHNVWSRTSDANDPNTNAMNPQMATIVPFQRCPMTLKPIHIMYKQNRRTRPHNQTITFDISPAAQTARNHENKCMHHVGRHIIWPAKAATTTRCNGRHHFCWWNVQSQHMMQRPRIECGCSGHQQGDDATVNTTVNIQWLLQKWWCNGHQHDDAIVTTKQWCNIYHQCDDAKATSTMKGKPPHVMTTASSMRGFVRETNSACNAHVLNLVRQDSGDCAHALSVANQDKGLESTSTIAAKCEMGICLQQPCRLFKIINNDNTCNALICHMHRLRRIIHDELKIWNKSRSKLATNDYKATSKPTS